MNNENGIWRTMYDKEPPIGDDVTMKWEGGLTQWVGNFYEEVINMKEECMHTLLWLDKKQNT